MARGQFACFSQSDDAGRVFRAAPTLLLLVSSDQEGCVFRALTDIKNTDPLGGMQLMAGQGKHIDDIRLHLERNLTDRLNRICVEQDPSFMSQLSSLFHGEKDSRFIIGPHQADNRRIRGQTFFILIEIQQTVFIDRQLRHVIALPGQICI